MTEGCVNVKSLDKPIYDIPLWYTYAIPTRKEHYAPKVHSPSPFTARP